ncbi:FxsA family protein [Peribacillus alkalitolerans]|uniref:FxsA family protein n=1 Tax=Peribacillus alkalitolerans TaxID=1550385 RepID=UPI0013D4DEA9|nr:FxsA family protein [Peribacillus alkalitolerans]
MKYLLLFLIIVPAAEIAILLTAGNTIGVLPTILLIIATGIAGSYLAKQQGLEVIRQAQRQMQYGQMPGNTIIDGICILVGGVLLLTPGFISDSMGFILLLPPTRAMIRPVIVRIFRKMIDKGNIKIIR